MKAALKIAALGVASLTLSGALDAARATSTIILSNGQTISGIAAGTSYQYGTATISFCNSSCSNASLSSLGNLDLVAVSNGRGGTSIEIESNQSVTKSSSILSGTSGNTNSSLAFNVTIKLSSGASGLTSITNVVGGSVTTTNWKGHTTSTINDNNLVASVLSPYSTGISSASSNLSSNSLVATVSPVLTANNSLTFNESLNLYTSSTTKSGETLSLNTVTFNMARVPEPATIALLSTGILGLVGLRRRRDHRAKAHAAG